MSFRPQRLNRVLRMVGACALFILLYKISFLHSDSLHPDDAVAVPTYSWFDERMQLCMRHILFEACAQMGATLDEMKARE